jgi:hypothetical protein
VPNRRRRGRDDCALERAGFADLERAWTGAGHPFFQSATRFDIVKLEFFPIPRETSAAALGEGATIPAS